MKRLLALSIMLILFVSKAPAEYTVYIFSTIANDRLYVWGGADSGYEDVYASTTLTITKGGVQQGSNYSCVPYTSSHDLNVPLSFSTAELQKWVSIIAGIVGSVNVISNQLEADTFKPKVYFKYTGGSCTFTEACDEWDGNSTGEDEQPLCELNQGYNGYMVNHGSAPCGSHISGEYKASRRGTDDWKCTDQNIDVESGPIECTHP